MSEMPPPPPPGDAPPPGWSGGQPGGWQQQQPGPGQPWPPQPGQPSPGMPWQAQPWGFTQAREHPQGTTVLVLGILGLVVCQVLGPFAWKMGNTALKEMDGQPDVTWSNRGNVTAGRILGIVSSVLLIIGVAFFVLWLLFAVAVVSST